MRHSALLAIALLIAVASAPASAQQPPAAVALVLEVRGATEPALKPYRELRAGERIRLYSGAKLVVLQYDSANKDCRTLTVEGGAVTFKSKGEPQIEGGVASAQDGKCPRRMATTSTSGAIIVRSEAKSMTRSPAFIVGGPRGSDIGWVRVLDENSKVAELAVTSQQFAWPKDAPALAANKIYTLEFLSRDNTAVLASMKVYTGATDNDPPNLVLID